MTDLHGQGGPDDLFGHTDHDTEPDEDGFRWCNDCERRYIPERGETDD